MASSRGCRRGPKDRAKPTVRPPSGSSPTGGECASARIQGTADVRPRGHVHRVRRRVARERSGPAASAICATPRQGSDRFVALTGGLRFAPTPGYSLACLRHAGEGGATPRRAGEAIPCGTGAPASLVAAVPRPSPALAGCWSRRGRRRSQGACGTRVHGMERGHPARVMILRARRRDSCRRSANEAGGFAASSRWSQRSEDHRNHAPNTPDPEGVPHSPPTHAGAAPSGLP